MALHKINVFAHSSGVQKSEMSFTGLRYWQDHTLSKDLQHALCLLQLRMAAGVLGLGPYHFNICPHLNMAFSLLKIRVIACGTHQPNPD